MTSFPALAALTSPDWLELVNENVGNLADGGSSTPENVQNLADSAPEGVEGGTAGPVLVLLHGYGSHEHDLAGLAPMLPAYMPWASLRAPLPMDFGGAAWFPLDLEGGPTPADLDAATDAIWAWIDAHVPVRAPVVPLGFSQGGCMALQLLRTRPERVLAPVVLSGFAAPVTQAGDDALAQSRPPVFWGRGDADPVIPAAMVAHLEEWLAAHADADTRVYPGLGHGITDQTMAEVRTFLARVLDQ